MAPYRSVLLAPSTSRQAQLTRLIDLTLKAKQVGEQEEIVKEDLLYLSIVGSEASERRPLDRDEDATEPAWWHVGHIPLYALSQALRETFAHGLMLGMNSHPI